MILDITLRRSEVQLETLSTEDTHASEHTRTLIIKCSTYSENRKEAMENEGDTPNLAVIEGVMKKYLGQALSLLKNVECVKYAVIDSQTTTTYLTTETDGL